MINYDNNPAQQICRGAAPARRSTAGFESTHGCDANETLALWPESPLCAAAPQPIALSCFARLVDFQSGDDAWLFGSVLRRLKVWHRCQTCIVMRDSSLKFGLSEFCC